MAIKFWLFACAAVAGVSAVLCGGPSVLREAPARLDIAWTASNSLGTYHLRGRFVIRGLSDGSATSISNEFEPGAVQSHVDVPPGLYSLTLEDGFQLARVDPALRGSVLEDEQHEGLLRADPDAEIVAYRLLSPNPQLVLAQAGRDTRAGLALVTRVDGTVNGAVCMN